MVWGVEDIIFKSIDIEIPPGRGAIGISLVIRLVNGDIRFKSHSGH